jgi:hypothetical protein
VGLRRRCGTLSGFVPLVVFATQGSPARRATLGCAAKPLRGTSVWVLGTNSLPLASATSGNPNFAFGSICKQRHPPCLRRRHCNCLHAFRSASYVVNATPPAPPCEGGERSFGYFDFIDPFDPVTSLTISTFLTSSTSRLIFPPARCGFPGQRRWSPDWGGRRGGVRRAGVRPREGQRAKTRCSGRRA